MTQIPAWIQKLAKGSRILCVDGATSDVDGVGQDVFTGHNAIATVDSVESCSQTDEVSNFFISFACGVTAIVTPQELAEGQYRPYLKPAERLVEQMHFLREGHLSGAPITTKVTKTIQLGGGQSFVITYHEGDDPMTKGEFHDNGVVIPLTEQQIDHIWDALI